MNKDIQDIQRLLDRFLDGASTLDEEKHLADYFRTHEVGEEWSAYKEMFAMFDEIVSIFILCACIPDAAISNTSKLKGLSIWQTGIPASFSRLPKSTSS